jgi:hypothetical protein
MPKKEIQEVKIKRDLYDWLMLGLAISSTISVLFGVTIQLPKIQQTLTNLTKSYNTSLGEEIKISETITTSITRTKTSNLTECSTCHEYPIEELNATLLVCDITITDLVTNTTNKTQELKLIR